MSIRTNESLEATLTTINERFIDFLKSVNIVGNEEGIEKTKDLLRQLQPNWISLDYCGMFVVLYNLRCNFRWLITGKGNMFRRPGRSTSHVDTIETIIKASVGETIKQASKYIEPLKN